MLAKNVAYFISPHGFGHAARACAVIEALHQLDPTIEFHLYTRAPRWFFDLSLPFGYHYHDVLTDIGLVQRSPLQEDLAATLERLEHFIPFSPELLAGLAQDLRANDCQVVVCDISPLGIAAARQAGLPSVLVENFTWDWIYSGYLDAEPRLERFIAEFQSLFQSAGAHIQTTPFCVSDSQAALVTAPVSRRPRASQAKVRQLLAIPPGVQMVLLSMGGIELHFEFLDRLANLKNIWFVIPGGAESYSLRQNLVLLPHHSDYYHPDLLHAADAVISKAGYSTISEAFYAGIPYGYVSRTLFREAPVLSKFIQQNMAGSEIDGETFQSGNWVGSIQALLRMPRFKRIGPDGSQQIARFLYENYLCSSR